MKHDTYKAMQITEIADQKFKREIINKNIDDLPKGDVLVEVKYSSLNYKDALSATGNKGVTRHYPHTPGIDAAGIVKKSNSSLFKAGDQVIITGYDLGMNTNGGFSQYISIPSEWIIPLPEGLSLKESMIYGTAGFTAALSVYNLIQSGVKPEDGSILVTGATGGVGSIAVSILHKLGYHVTASTGKLSEADKLKALGANEIIQRDTLDDHSGKALLKAKWAGVVDTVGGNTLATAIKSTQYGGSVTCSGNVSSPDILTSIYPFIIKGIKLIGIDSVQCPKDIRLKIWSNLSSKWKLDHIEQYIEEVSLEGVCKKIDLILNGKAKGRTVVNLNL